MWYFHRYISFLQNYHPKELDATLFNYTGIIPLIPSNWLKLNENTYLTPD
jgi:hypothetical protein